MMIEKRLAAATLIFLAVFMTNGLLRAEEASGIRKGGDADLAQELTNPLANLMTIPVQVNYDKNTGIHDDGQKWQANIQPVIPFDLSQDWGLISRTILPVIDQKDIFPRTWCLMTREWNTGWSLEPRAWLRVPDEKRPSSRK